MASRAEPLNPAGPSQAYRWYVVGILALVYAVSIIDRNLLSILQEPIRHELGLSDTQLGLLSGFAFAIFYATLSIPIARFADRTHRVRLVTAALTLWSIMTLGCGMATGFLSLFLFRVGVGVGEAGGYPPSAAIVSEYFGPKNRTTAMSVLGLGVKGGAAMGLLIGGLLHELVGWRHTLMILGGAGVVLAVILVTTVREPIRGMQERQAAADRGVAPREYVQPPFRQTMAFLWRLKSLRFILLGNAITGIAITAHQAWTPSFFVRTYGLSVGEVASMLGTISLVTAMSGILIGARLAETLARRDPRWFAWVSAIGASLLAPLAILQFTAPQAWMSFAAAGTCYFLVAMLSGPVMGISQTLVSPTVRATTAAINLMVYSLIGSGIGPVLAGWLTETFTAAGSFGPSPIRYSLSVVMVMAVLGATLFLRASRTMARDLARDFENDFPTKEPTA
jgi:MFS family permease